MVVAKHLAVFLLWNITAGAVLLSGNPALGLPMAIALYLLLLKGYLLKPAADGGTDREEALRLRPLTGEALKWTLIAVPVVLLLSSVVGDVYTRFVTIPANNLNPFEPVMETASGRLAIALFAIGVAPVVEEFVFRGLIQRHLERKRGIAHGIVVAGALFAAIHLLPYIFPLHFFLGVAFGFAVYATGSIWTGVILHAANNATAMIGSAFAPTEDIAIPTVWEEGVSMELVSSLLMLPLALALAIWTGRQLLKAGREARMLDTTSPLQPDTSHPGS